MRDLGASLRSLCLCVGNDGSGTGVADYFYKAYQGDNAALEIHDVDGLAVSGYTPHLEHRYLYGQATDEILASENASGAVLWGLGDHEGTIRDIVGNVALGAVGNGVAAQDAATGTGFILYSVESVWTRFSANPPETYNSDHLISVKYINGQWCYDNNYGYYAFTPRASDVLVAAVDFTNDTITGLQGVNAVEQGIVKGYSAGDLTFAVNFWGGVANPGEFLVQGTYFIRNDQQSDHRKYDSFGKMTSESAPATDFIFGYTGQALDKDTGLMDYGHRWYDASVGRFASEDPSGFDAGDMNLYRYVGNNPLNNTDPSGLCNKSNYGFSGYLSGPIDMDAAYRSNSLSYLPPVSSVSSPAIRQFTNPNLGGTIYQSGNQYWDESYEPVHYDSSEGYYRRNGAVAPKEPGTGLMAAQALTGVGLGAAYSVLGNVGKGIVSTAFAGAAATEGYNTSIYAQASQQAYMNGDIKTGSQYFMSAVGSAGSALGYGTAATAFAPEVRGSSISAPSENSLVFDRYGTLRDSDIPGQAHHLNQNAAYGGVIPQNEGVSTKLVGNAFNEPGTPHYETHDIMEGFWDVYRPVSPTRPQGMLFGETPTNSQYNRALYNSLQEGGGLTPAEALQAVRAAKAQQLEYGLHGWQDVPNRPNPINQQGGQPRW